MTASRPVTAPGPARPAGGSHLLLELVARTPLRTWTDGFGMTPAEILDVPSGGWSPTLFTGWSRAAVTQGEQEWMAALTSWILAGGLPGAASGVGDPAPSWSGGWIRIRPCSGPAPTCSRLTLPAVRDAVDVLRFRYQMLKELDDDDSAG